MPSEQGEENSCNLPVESSNPRISIDGTEVLCAQDQLRETRLNGRSSLWERDPRYMQGKLQKP